MRDGRHLLFWIAALLALVLLAGLLRDVMLPFVAGAVIAYFLDPLAGRLAKAGLGRTLTSALMVGLAAALFTLVVLLLAPLAVEHIGQLAARLPSDLERIRGALDAWAEQRLGGHLPALRESIDRAFRELSQGSSGLVAEIARGAWSRGSAILNLASLVLITPIVVFYLLRDWPAIVARLDDWLPRRHAPAIRAIGRDIDRAVSAFVRGQGTICLLLAAFYATGLSAVGLRYGVVIGAITGLLAFVPFVGWAAGLATATIAAVSQAWPDTLLVVWMGGVFAAGLALDSVVLSPILVGQRIGLHPVWLMLALLAFSALMGFVGTLIAVPVAAALAVIVRFGRDRYLESDIYLGESQPPPRGDRGLET